MTYNDQEMMFFDQIKKQLLKLCKQSETGDFSLFTDQKQTAVINLYKGDIVGLRYRITQGTEAISLIKGIQKAKMRFRAKAIDSCSIYTAKIPSTIDVLRRLGVKLDGLALRNLGQKILVVDDSDVQRKMICRMLVVAGYRTIEAKDGYSALAILENEEPDLILLDIVMPGIDGYKLLSLIKRQEEKTDIPIIMMTSRNNLLDKVRSKTSNNSGYLTKPFSSEKLINKVDKFLFSDFYNQVEVPTNRPRIM